MHRSHSLPVLSRTNNATRLLVDGQPTLLLGGELHNSSSSSLGYMDREVWRTIEALGCNTILSPISWELVEPEEGRFDFTLVDGLIEQARRRKVFLVPLWFGAYKNAQSNYAPAWVKRNIDRFPRAEAQDAIRTEAVTVLSKELRDADAKAFAAVMRRIRELDPQGKTVVMVQVENEVGLLGGSRDMSAMAQAAYAEPVPSSLLTCLSEPASELQPGLKALWTRHGSQTSGSWGEVFGDGPDGDEVFMAWHFASYVGAVAAAGIAEHPIPMYANAWLVQHDGQAPGGYPCGGPVAHMIDVWRAAAPNLAFLAPDVYLPAFARECHKYTVSDNVLFIPEMPRDLSVAAKAFYAIGEHAAIGVAPFGIDSLGVVRETPAIAAPSDTGNPVAAVVASAHDHSGRASVSPAELIAASYRLLADMSPILLNADAADIRGFLEDATVAQSPDSVLELGEYRITIAWDNARKARETGKTERPFVCCGGLVVKTPNDEYIFAGFGFRVRFSSLAGDHKKVEYLSIDEGDFRGGRWIPGRRLNGDEYRIDLPLDSTGQPKVRRVVPYSYPAMSR